MAENEENGVGRPTVMTPEVLAKLEWAFLRGYSDRQACLHAGINPMSLYRYQDENREYSERKAMLKENISIVAKENIIETIQAKHIGNSVWWLERQDSDFNPKQKVEHSGGLHNEVTQTPAVLQALKGRFEQEMWQAIIANNTPGNGNTEENKKAAPLTVAPRPHPLTESAQDVWYEVRQRA